MKTMKTTLMVLAALAAMVGRASESAEFRLDTMDGTRVARAVEKIAYSTAWNNGGSVSVAVDGVAVKTANAPASGDVVWNAAQATPGKHTLTHTCGGETLTAVFRVSFPPPELTVETADWTLGRITLRCGETGMGVADAPFYTLSYFDTEKGQWLDIDRDDLIPSPAVETNADGVEALITKITDREFARRNNGVGTVRYRVRDENGRVSAECVTRTRYGMFVATGEYKDPGITPLPTPKRECAVFRAAYMRYGQGEELFPGLDDKPSKAEVLFALEYAAGKVKPGDVFVFYFAGHGGAGFLPCYDYNSKNGSGAITAEDLSDGFAKFSDGVGMVAVIYCCHSESMFIQDNNSMNLGRVGWIFSSQAGETTKSLSLTTILCNQGWFDGEADMRNGEYGTGDGDGYVTFGELAAYGYSWTRKNNLYQGHIQRIDKANDFILDNIMAGKVPSNSAEVRTLKWLSLSAPSTISAADGDVTKAMAMTAANGCRTVGECYALGIDPEDPDDDLRITHFEIENGKPVITLNHTEDGSGNSFTPRVKTLGKANLSDAEWREVPEGGDASLRFFKVVVEMP